MAFAPDRFEMSMTFRDSGGETTVKNVEIQAVDMTAALADAATLVALYAAVTDASIDRYTVSQVFIEGAPKVFVDATVKNSIQAVITVSLAGDVLKKATIVIPAPNIGIFSAVTGENSDIVDSADAEVVALVEGYQLAGQAYLSDHELVHATTPNIKGIRRTIKRRLA